MIVAPVNQSAEADITENALLVDRLLRGAELLPPIYESGGTKRRILLSPLFQKLLDGIPEQVALLTQDGIILAVNHAWHKRAVQLNVESWIKVGCDYFEILARSAATGDNGARGFLRKLSDISAGRRSEFTHHYVGLGPVAGQAFKICATRISWAGELLIILDFRDETDLLDLRRQHRRLGSRLLHTQDEERRRMARDLHDSASQLLVGLQLNLAQLKRDRVGPRADELFAECKSIIDSVQTEIRTFAFIHHPPSLDIDGIGPAIKTLMTGFGRRTGLNVETVVDGIRETSYSIEATLYRVAQEALANVHRHSKATTVKLWLTGTDTDIHLVINDDGIGFEGEFPERPAQLGVGIMGMRERVAEFGGRLSIHKLSRGTSVTATMPHSLPGKVRQAVAASGR